MKKILIAICGLTIFSCSEGEPYFSSTYIYRNQLKKEITIESFYIWIGGHVSDSNTTFHIAPGEEVALVLFMQGNFPPPFTWSNNPYDDDYTIFYNGEKQFKNIRRSENPEETRLYRKESYTLLKDKKYEKTFQYVFTDKDFENAQPIEL